MSEGRRQLLRALQITTALEVAARCRVTHQAVSQWASGATKPSDPNRKRLAEHLYITGEW